VTLPDLAHHVTHVRLMTTIIAKTPISLIHMSDILPCDALITMPMHAVDSMFKDGVHLFPHPWLYFDMVSLPDSITSPIPSTLRLWRLYIISTTMTFHEPYWIKYSSNSILTT
jgi:hypothetical protein